ncbi:histidine kinase [Mucilaginibacter roseus]|uniref:Histidine kinase n=1 Tax=Mucilaginibacter roseus TaxID=1528868 RepID=A0ABS8U597_9SPHI|nr:histidine kinase [Mucilaginibacter roseus]MCD8741213.1 histidine kinase [Mucilaginibacter roseus]
MLKSLQTKLKTETLIELLLVALVILATFIVHLFDAADIVKINRLNGIPTTYGFLLAPAAFKYAVTFVCYLLLCAYVAPEFKKPEGQSARPAVLVYALIAVSLLLNLISIYFGALLALRLWIILFTRTNRSATNALNYESGLLTASWIFLTVASVFVDINTVIRVFILLVIPACIIVYLYAMYRILPRNQHKKWLFLNYFIRIMPCIALSTLVTILTVAQLKEHNYPYSLNEAFRLDLLNFKVQGNDIEALLVICLLTHLLFVIPFAWSNFKSRNRKLDQQINELKTELGQTDANLNFLKSQINPHFLFNALNTLYGTALQENAERTGEGIQKLGDMMRLMLQENMKDKIALTMDIDYLNNYILLQKLRTATSANVVIEAEISNDNPDLLIAPMLLIPFVENAFKHGISLINPSFIKMKLVTSGNTLYFDVHNSIHLKSDNDPEKGQSGIGLENVKQRLNLLYNNKHELIIRETAKDFFVHLTLQLEDAV